MQHLTDAEYKAQVIEFSQHFGTQRVRDLVRFCKQGFISWEDAYALCQRSLAKALEEVTTEGK